MHAQMWFSVHSEQTVLELLSSAVSKEVSAISYLSVCLFIVSLSFISLLLSMQHVVINV